MIRRLLYLPFMLLTLLPDVCHAQENTKSTPDPKFYRLDFVVKEVDDGRVLNARIYSIMDAANSSGARSSIRAGSKVPVQNGPTASQFTYVDVGVNIDVSHLTEKGSALSMGVTSEVSSYVLGPDGALSTQPVIRNNRWDSSVVVELRKPTLIFSSDDPGSKRKMQLELTATPINP